MYAESQQILSQNKLNLIAKVRPDSKQELYCESWSHHNHKHIMVY